MPYVATDLLNFDFPFIYMFMMINHEMCSILVNLKYIFLCTLKFFLNSITSPRLFRKLDTIIKTSLFTKDVFIIKMLKVGENAIKISI